jgi:redox-sensitive bicupin YhaK (pirin superfamily)
MMLIQRPAAERGHANHGWLDTYHSFSFNTYRDPEWMRFANLRVLNEDRVAPGAGFATHPHHEMEIITYVVAGEIAHEDSLGHREVLKAGEVQVMSAGTGLTHSEFNASETETLHLLQIWVLPRERGAVPRYDQRAFPPESRRGQLKLLVAPFGAETDAADVLRIHADCHMYGAVLAGGAAMTHELPAGRSAWVQVVSGEVEVNGTMLAAGDGLGVEAESALDLRAHSDCEFLLFELAPPPDAN